MKKLSCLLIVGLFFVSTTYALEIGQPAPDFTLNDIDGKPVALSDFKGKVVVLEWFNWGCPFVRKHYDKGDMQNLQNQFGNKEIVWLIVNSTNEKHRDYRNPAETKKIVAENSIAGAHLLLDAEGEVGKAYKAKTTPHMFVINPKGTVVYAGAIDNNSSADPSTIPDSENYVVAALSAGMSGKEVRQKATKPYGCSVKYSN